MNVPVVIVTRNNLALTKKTLASVFAQDVPVDVLIVDNSSMDGSRQYLNTKPVATIMTPEQWSLAKCWNTALRSLWKMGYDRALVINNDVELLPQTARILDAHGGPFVTAVSVNTRGQIDNVQTPDIAVLRAGARPHPDYSCWLIRKSVTDRNIWFDEECWPGYAEDSFHHKAMHDAGIPAVCIDVPFLHHSASTLKSCSVAEGHQIRRGADRNRQRFKAKYGCLPGSPEYEALFV